MPTKETWLEANIITTEWQKPLTKDELGDCFNQLAAMLKEKDGTVHILFDIEDGGNVPAQAPVLAIKSGFLSDLKLGRVAVVGMSIVPQVLSQVAASVANKDIKFFPLFNSALAYLKSNEDD